MAEPTPVTPRKTDLIPQSAANLRANLMKRKEQSRNRAAVTAALNEQGETE